MALGNVIRLIRKARGFKQYVLAKEAGISCNFLSLVESGKRAPSIEVLNRLAKVLKVPTAAFFVWQEAGDDELKAGGLDKIVILLMRLEAMCSPAKSNKKNTV